LCSNTVPRLSTVNRHNYCVWGSENPHDVTDYDHDSPKVNVQSALIKNKFFGPFLLEEPTVAGDIFLAMMKNTALCYVPVGTVFQSEVALRPPPLLHP